MFMYILGAISYFLIAIIVKSYYKLHRYKDPLEVMKEEPYLVGLGWPIYLIYRLVAWPFVSGSRFVEKVMTKSEPKEEVKIRVTSRLDKEIAEAEEEIEEMLAKRNSL